MIPEVQDRRAAPALARRLFVYTPAAAWAALLLVLGSIEHLPGPSSTLPTDKVAHFIGYGILGVLAALGWRLAGRWPAPAWPLLLVLGLAAVDELLQIRQAGRHAELADWFADAAGALTGFALMARFRSSTSREDAE